MTATTTRTLYHLKYSPFSRRVRLGLAHKRLECELREVGENPAWFEEARSLVPLKTMPVLVDSGRALADSTAITRWLDSAYPQLPSLWLQGDDAFDCLQMCVLVDAALNLIVDVGTRYFALRDHPSWGGVKAEMLGRAQRALDALADRAQSLGRATIAKGGWSAADIWLYTGVVWMAGLPERAAKGVRNPSQIVAVGGWTLPDGLRRWADAHHDRADVRALG